MLAGLRYGDVVREEATVWHYPGEPISCSINSDVLLGRAVGMSSIVVRLQDGRDGTETRTAGDDGKDRL